MEQTIRLGVSACLLGHEVRYNGGHSRDRFITDTLGMYVQFVPVCPEVECGFGVPRETLRLAGDPESPRLMTGKTHRDVTEQMRQWAHGRVVELEKEDLCGFIFKKGSPSSGMQRVKVYTEKGMPSHNGVGMFARAFMEHFPLLPTEEDGRLNDPKLRENFVESIFTLRRWRDVLASTPRRGDYVEFHTQNKLLLFSHSPTHYRLMGKLVAGIKSLPIEEFRTQYQTLLLQTLQLKTTIKKNSDALFHIMGYFKKVLTPDEKQELIGIIETYRVGYVPLVVPITLLKHYARKHDQTYLKQQSYLDPHPVELQLRNHA
jgi:uncharacterized protein YbgA (DUF1722 family)/uncharacterized protein YbbK (DUF523 family)